MISNYLQDKPPDSQPRRNLAEEETEREVTVPEKPTPSYEQNPQLLAGFNMAKLRALKKRVEEQIYYDGTGLRPTWLEFLDEDAKVLRLPPPKSEADTINSLTLVFDRKTSSTTEDRQLQIKRIAQKIIRCLRGIILTGQLSGQISNKEGITMADLLEKPNQYRDALMAAYGEGLTFGELYRGDPKLIYVLPVDVLSDIEHFQLTQPHTRSDQIHTVNWLFAERMGFVGRKDSPEFSNPRVTCSTLLDDTPTLNVPHLTDPAYRLEWILQDQGQGDSFRIARSRLCFNQTV